MWATSPAWRIADGASRAATVPAVSSPARSDRPRAREVLRDRSVAGILGTSALSSTAALIQAIALGKFVFDLTGRELDLGLVGLAEFLPSAVLVLVTGSVADRYDRRRIGALALAGEALCAVALALYAAGSGTAIWPIFIIVIAFGVARGFAAPALRSIPPMVAPEGKLSQVVAFHSASWQAASIVGPVLGGFLYAAEPWIAFAAAAGVFCVAIVAVLSVKMRNQPPPVTDRPSISHALEGLRFIRRTPLLLAAISLDLFAVLFGGAVALLPAIAEKRLGVGAVGLGWLRAAGGIGASLTAAVLAVRPFRRRVGRWLLIAVGVFGVATVVLGLTRSYVVAFVAMALLTSADMVSVFVRGTLVPLATPNEMRGRVLAVEQVFIGASNELGAFESGVAAAVMGLVAAVASGGVATLVIVGLWWVLFPALRDVDTFDDVSPPAVAAPG